MQAGELERLVGDAERIKPSENNYIQDVSEPDFERGLRFWLVMACMLLGMFMASLDSTAVSTALPTIAASFNSGQFFWVGSAYAISGGASTPFAGNCANLFGRRPVLITSLLLFTAGTTISGSARSISMLIGARTIQGAGSGGIIAINEMILSDLVPLSVRGKYQGIFGLVSAISSCSGPFVGGAFATRKDWSWRGLFYFNLPLACVAIFLSLFCLDLKVPDMTLAEKLRQIDWIGNLIITASVTSTLIGLALGGNLFPWSSAHVLIPLILGVLGIFTWVFYEIWLAERPFLISRLFTNRTTVSGYIGTAIHGLVIAGTWFAFPIFFQACQGASPIQSGANILPFSLTIAPMAIVAGAAAAVIKRYRVQNIIAWCFVIVGLGLTTTLQVTTTRNWIVFELITGIGFGLLFTSTVFAILAPLMISDNGTALAFYTFVRWFFQALGITITAAVLQNQLKSRIPQEVIQTLPADINLAYSVIPHIPSLPDHLQLTVKTAFAQSLRTLWFVLLGISVVGFLSTLLMKDVKLQGRKDERWGMRETASLRSVDS